MTAGRDDEDMESRTNIRHVSGRHPAAASPRRGVHTSRTGASATHNGRLLTPDARCDRVKQRCARRWRQACGLRTSGISLRGRVDRGGHSFNSQLPTTNCQRANGKAVRWCLVLGAACSVLGALEGAADQGRFGGGGSRSMRYLGKLTAGRRSEYTMSMGLSSDTFSHTSGVTMFRRLRWDLPN